MRLQKLVLSNFQGVKSAEYDFFGFDANILGDNATGKTTIANAVMWLLFDRCYNDTPGFCPKPHAEDGDDCHNLHTAVDAVFSLDDGRRISLGKDLYEVWQKKRGSQTAEFTGNKTDYAIDGVPVPKKDYDSRAAELCPPELVKVLTNPTFFSLSLPWQERRKILLDVCGDVSDSDVINSNSELQDLMRYLIIPGTDGQLHTVDDYKLIAAATKSKINDRLNKLPERIDEAAKAIPNATDIDVAAIKSEIAQLEGQKEQLSSQLASFGENDAVNALRQRLSNIGIKISDAKSEYQNSFGGLLDAFNRQLSELQEQSNNIRMTATDLENEHTIISRKIEAMKSNRAELSNSYSLWMKKAWQGDTACPTCGQGLPAEQIEAAKAKFNAEKSQMLEKIRSSIEQNCSKPMIAAAENDLIEHEKKYDATVKQLSKFEIEISSLKLSRPTITPFESTESYADLSAEKAEIEAKMSNAFSDVNGAKDEIRAQISNITVEITKLQSELYIVSAAETQKKRVDELLAEEKRLAQEFDEVSRGIYLCELFIKTKVSMLTDRINDRFQSVKFRLFETQINGGLKECCEVLVPSAANTLDDYRSSANSAAKLNAGLEIIDTLSRHYGYSMPVIIDNAESVVRWHPISAQVIRLTVDGSCPKLLIELENPASEVA